MRFVIVTGMSGAGKSTALKMLEDMEYFCVDNLPVPLIDKFVQLIKDSASGEIERVAIGVDIRSGRSLDELKTVLEKISFSGIESEILFLDADDTALVRRYKETRRSHPLAGAGRVDDGIQKERERLQFLKEYADYILDTSKLLTRELKAELEKIFVENRTFKNLMVTVLSFGFKYGIPQDADLVFDVRFLPNPYYLENLRPLSGNDRPVSDYVMGFEAAHVFSDKLEDMIRFLIPNYILEGKTQLVIAVGCTGGKHRSVTLANELYRRLGENDTYGIRIEHRDIEKDGKKMSFSGSVKEELLRCIDSARHCQIAELAAVLAFDGEIVRLGQGQIDLRVSSENESLVRKYFTLLQKTFTMNDSVSIDNRITKKNNRFLMELKDSQLAVKVLQAVKLLGADRMPQNLDALVNQMVVQRNCCKRAFIRGAFLCAGSISDPEKFYHFEIVCSSKTKAVQLMELIQSFEVDAKIVKRKKYYVVYVKEGAQIVELLGIMGAGVSLMNLENVRILKDMRNTVNRKSEL